MWHLIKLLVTFYHFWLKDQNSCQLFTLSFLYWMSYKTAIMWVYEHLQTSNLLFKNIVQANLYFVINFKWTHFVIDKRFNRMQSIISSTTCKRFLVEKRFLHLLIICNHLQAWRFQKFSETSFRFRVSDSWETVGNQFLFL